MHFFFKFTVVFTVFNFHNHESSSDKTFSIQKINNINPDISHFFEIFERKDIIRKIKERNMG